MFLLFFAGARTNHCGMRDILIRAFCFSFEMTIKLFCSALLPPNAIYLKTAFLLIRLSQMVLICNLLLWYLRENAFICFHTLIYWQ